MSKYEPIIQSKDNLDDNVYFTATHWQLVRRSFRKHKLAVFSGYILIIFYIIGIFCEFFSPYDTLKRNSKYVNAPPQTVHFFDKNGFSLRPFTYIYKKKLDPETFERIYSPDKNKRVYIYFFVKGLKYKFWNIFWADIHLFGVNSPGTLFLLGTDNLGRDMFSRIIYASRVSLFIGIIGVLMSFILGTSLGAMSGYYGGVTDMIIQRIIEFLRSIPTIPLWMGLSAAVPQSWTPLQVYFAITLILSLLGWTTMARVVRGKFLEMREEEYILAARLSGTKTPQIIIKHMIPGFMSYIIVSATLAVPSMIIAETVLSFLGLGLRPPVVSWGVLLQMSQNILTIAVYPWQMAPVIFVIITVLAFNFVGDGLRDAADPYQNH